MLGNLVGTERGSWAWALTFTALVCCGGSDSGDTSGVGGTSATATGGSGGMVVVPEKCSGPSECPAGYDCVPNIPKLVETVDQPCLAMCADRLMSSYEELVHEPTSAAEISAG